MTLNRLGRAGLACALLLAGCGSGEVPPTPETDEEEAPPVPVETARPERGDVVAVYSGTAPIEAFAEADVIAKVEGEIREILVEEGDAVTEGQVLARLDGDRLRLELSESRAQLQKMERDFKRNEELSEKGLLSEGDFEKLQYDLEALRASYKLASLELDYTQIRAPIDGVISQRFARIGNTIKVGDPVFRVTGMDPLVAYLHVPEREFRNIAPGQPVDIAIDALGNERVQAKVSRVGTIVDPDTGTFKITIEISDPEQPIKPGMFGRMSIIFDRHENVLKVPRSVLIEGTDGMHVFVVEDDVAIRRPVETGYSANGFVEITSGLDDDDDVVVVGQVGLKPDAGVIVINAPDAGGDAVEETVGETD